MYPAGLHKIPTGANDLSQFFENSIVQKQPKTLNRMTESLEKKTVKDVEHVCPEQELDFLFDCCRLRHNFAENSTYLLFIDLAHTLSYSIGYLGETTESI